MNRLAQVFATIRKSLASLTIAQRLLVAACALVIVLTLVLVSVFTASPVMSELAGFTPERMREALPLLEASGINAKVTAGRLMVPSEKQQLALGVLAQGGKLPDDTATLFSNLASKQSWMSSKSENDRQFNIALQNELAIVIKNFKGVRRASVLIDAPEPMGLGLAVRKPTAAVTVQTEAARPLDSAMVDAIAALVSGAKAGLSLSDVRVIDATTRRQFRARADEDVSSGDYLEHAAKVENRVQEKIATALSYMRPPAVVAVNAQVDVRKSTTSETSMLPVSPEGGSVAIVQEETNNNSSTTGGGATGPVPGLQSNATEDITRGSGGANGPKTSDEKTDTKFKVEVGRKTRTTVDPRGMPTKINVMVSVPREYIAALARAAKGDKADPKAEIPQADLDAAFATEQTRLLKDLQPLVETAAGEAGGAGGAVTQAGIVTVSMIPVPMGDGVILPGGMVAAAGLGGGGGGSDGGGIGALVGSGLVKQAFLGVLALVALGMMFMLVKKSSQPLTLPTPQELVGAPPTLDTQSDLVGEADESQTAMLGIELGDGDLKTKKMLEQVVDMVKKNPGDAAGLINRWITTEN